MASEEHDLPASSENGSPMERSRKSIERSPIPRVLPSNRAYVIGFVVALAIIVVAAVVLTGVATDVFDAYANRLRGLLF